jgi:hypothetical protein
MGIDVLLIELNKNPMFHLSLGSKELFHGNFLAFLWDQNPKAFLELLNDLCLNSINVADLLNEKELTLDREKENFDICIHHKEGKKEIYDIIIENKVKSIPYKEQLEDYEDKVRKHQKGRTIKNILLTLADNFPNANNIKGWIIVSYKALAQKLKSSKSDFSSSNRQILQYIEDYIDFIKQLTPLKDKILEDLKNNGPYHQQEDINTFHKYKLSDLYIKLRGAYFIGLIKDKLESTYNKNGVDVEYFTSSKFEERRRGGSGEKTMIWLHSGMNRGKSTVTASINPANSENLYELQIEGDQYRHMFNQNGLVAKRGSVSKNLLNIPYFDYNNLPSKVNNNWAGKSDFNQYKPNYLYKYVKFDSEIKVNEMIDILVEDIQNVLRYRDKCENVVSDFLN